MIEWMALLCMTCDGATLRPDVDEEWAKKMSKNDIHPSIFIPSFSTLKKSSQILIDLWANVWSSLILFGNKIRIKNINVTWYDMIEVRKKNFYLIFVSWVSVKCYWKFIALHVTSRTSHLSLLLRIWFYKQFRDVIWLFKVILFLTKKKK